MADILCFVAGMRQQNSLLTQKKWGIVALTLGVILWLAGFAAIGGEWFRMWMSTKTYHGVEASFRLFMMMIVVLIYLIIPEGDSTQSTNSKSALKN
ncbi:Predicted small integral membrane protein (DUF2165) [Salmonella enterica subsp. arizonae]|nr:Predicted small integral membrane protein (DUF2165) [Salmonella enterica subsp. arizonae]